LDLIFLPILALPVALSFPRLWTRPDSSIFWLYSVISTPPCFWVFTAWTSFRHLPSPSATMALAALLLVSHPFRHRFRFLFCPISDTFIYPLPLTCSTIGFAPLPALVSLSVLPDIRSL
jgi:hypothetical protein